VKGGGEERNLSNKSKESEAGCCCEPGGEEGGVGCCCEPGSEKKASKKQSELLNSVIIIKVKIAASQTLNQK